MTVCSMSECGSIASCRGWCNKHYLRWLRNGDPSVISMILVHTRKKTPIEERFWSKVNKTESCWLWTGTMRGGGYGGFWVNGKAVLAHRFAYELLIGPIPDGLEIDHVKNNGCTNRNCVKAIADEFGPAHLEPVTPLENQQRGNTFTAAHCLVTHCLRGHEYSGDNLYRTPDGRRDCRACRKDARERYVQKKKVLS